MLVFERGLDQSFVVETPSGDITVTVVSYLQRDKLGNRLAVPKVRLGITAPREFQITRSELLQAPPPSTTVGGVSTTRTQRRAG